MALEECFERLQSAPMLSQDELADIVRDFKALTLDIENSLRLSRSALSLAERATLVEMRKQDIDETRWEAGGGDFGRAELALSAMIARRHLVLNDSEKRQLGQALLLAGVEVMGISLAGLGGDASGLASGDRETAKVVSPAQHHGPISTHSSGTSAGAATPGRADDPLFSVVAAEFLDHQRKGKIWDEQTIRQAQKTFELVTEIVGDRPISRYARPDANKLKATLQELPADYGKAAVFRGRPALEIADVDRGRKPTSERLSLRTVKRHLSVLSSLWKWVAREGDEIANPFLGFAFPSLKRANEQRDMWNTEDLKALFGSPVWNGCRSAARRTEPGTLILRDEKFWLPLIALFSGMRQEEICQLQVEDVRTVDGYCVFDINARLPRRLKNKNAIRKVPVHPQLVKMGLLEFAAEKRAGGHKALFPDLSPGGADDRLGHSYSKWFARYRQAIGIYRRGLDFHSLRHTATTLLYRGGVQGPLIDELTGHATPGETARYTHGTGMKQLAEAMTALSPELDLARLYVTS